MTPASFLNRNSTEDALDFLLVNLHHEMNRLCTPPTSIVNYMQCKCPVHNTTALHYFFVRPCGSRDV